MLIILFIKVLLFLLLLSVSYSLLRYFEESKVVSHSFHQTIKKVNDTSKARKEKELQLRLEEGSQEKDNFLYRIDLMIEQSNLRHIFSFMNSEIYLFLTFSNSLIGFLITNFMTRYWIFGFGVMLLVLVLSFLLIYALSSINFNKTEKNIITFTNLLENFSKTSDDIVEIFHRTHPFLEEPLKENIHNFYQDAIHTGDISGAFRNLIRKVEHPKFKEIIRNIEMCSRHEANYQEIIRDNRQMLRDYLRAKEERKEMVNNGRMEITLLLVISGVMIYLLNGFVQNLSGVLLNSMVGNIILLYCLFILAICCWIMIAVDKK